MLGMQLSPKDIKYGFLQDPHAILSSKGIGYDILLGPHAIRLSVGLD
jgi:hypothetical protein